MSEIEYADYLVVGGGIAGVSCTEMLYTLDPEAKITLVTATAIVKSVSNVNQITKLITEFQVEEQTADQWRQSHSGVSVYRGKVDRVDPKEKIVHLEDGMSMRYRKLCICGGAQPKLITENPLVLGIRDTHSVLELQDRLVNARKIIVIGNGGIATELVYELENVEIVWAVKNDAIASVFLDPGASQFLLKEVEKEREEGNEPSKRRKYTVEDATIQNTVGSALGPDWHKVLSKKGKESRKKVDIKYGVKVEQFISKDEFKQLKDKQGLADEFEIYVQFTDGTIVGADFVISATGVRPGGGQYSEIVEVNAEGAIIVNSNMETSAPDIYAAGDICHAGWEWSKHWMQMRLWTQARQMGMFAAKCMYYHTIKEPIELDFCFEMFAHVTQFFGQKVILLGLFKGQKLNDQYELLVRVTPGKEYVKAVMKDGKMQGAVLIGETDLEETFENLILNQMDLSAYGEELLSPEIDLEDYFD